MVFSLLAVYVSILHFIWKWESCVIFAVKKSRYNSILDTWKNNPCIKNGGKVRKQINIYIHTEGRQLRLLGKRCEITWNQIFRSFQSKYKGRVHTFGCLFSKCTAARLLEFQCSFYLHTMRDPDFIHIFQWTHLFWKHASYVKF